MCGIVGFTGETSREALEKMTNSIIHRGPDDAAYIVSKDFSVGYRRLAIIDLSKNIYPIENESKSIELVLNGEIYNYQKLRKELSALGHEFKTESDSEVIVHGYEEWGKDVVKKLRGMFVFVLFDKSENILYIGRDRLGIKPFYYSKFENRIVFGSEIKGLFAGFNINKTPNEKAVYEFLVSRIHDYDVNTFFKDIKRLLPGHTMTIYSNGNFDIEKYWNPTVNTQFNSKKSDADYANEFREIFKEAVDLHLISDVPVGITLSGGLDSSGITTLASNIYKEKNIKSDLYTFSAIHPGETINEESYIDEVVKNTNVKSVKVIPQVDKFWEDLDEWVYYQEEPVISGAPYAYYTVMREAKKNVTVLLSGQGGDELLAGYIPYFMSYFKTAIQSGNYWPALRESIMGSDLYFKFVLNLLKNKLDNNAEINPSRVLNSEFAKNQQLTTTKFVHKDNLNERLFEDVTSTTTPCLLRYEDKNGMAHSLESRVPFFDHEVVEYLFNLPIDQKIKFGWNRYIYRNAMRGVLPEKIIQRRSKVGFTNPEWEWIERKQDKFIEIFNSKSFRGRSFWDADKVLEDFNLALQGKLKGDILFFWRLFSVEMWLRKFVD